MSDDDLLRRADAVKAIRHAARLAVGSGHRYEDGIDDAIGAIRALPSPGSSDPAVLFRSELEAAAIELARAVVAERDDCNCGPDKMCDVHAAVDAALARFRAADAEEKS